MTQNHLVACTSCARHVRASETTCPFCANEVAESIRSSTPRRAPAKRLSRAALVAFGAGSLAVATACGGSVSGGGSGDKDSGTTVDGEVHDDAVGPGTDATGVLYGGFPVDASFLDVDETPDADKHETSFAPPYGIAPPPEDAGAPSDANDDDADASLPDSGIAVPYGVPVGDP